MSLYNGLRPQSHKLFLVQRWHQHISQTTVRHYVNTAQKIGLYETTVVKRFSRLSITSWHCTWTTFLKMASSICSSPKNSQFNSICENTPLCSSIRAVKGLTIRAMLEPDLPLNWSKRNGNIAKMSDLPCPVGSDTKTAFSFKEASMTSSCLGFRLEWPIWRLQDLLSE